MGARSPKSPIRLDTIEKQKSAPIASVAQRLGHSSMMTTQKTYLHIIQELENKDVDLVMRSLSSLN